MRKTNTLHTSINPIDLLIIILSLFISNRRTWLCWNEINKPLFSCEVGNWLGEIILFLFLMLIVLWQLKSKNMAITYWSAWKKKWLLFFFLILCILSFGWSINKMGTLQRIFQIIPATITAAYLGFRYKNEKTWICILFFFIMTTTVLSYLLVLALPSAAIMSSHGLIGMWRGIFSHKNYMGSIMSLGTTITLLQFMMVFLDGHKIRAVGIALLYLASWGLVISSQSTTGLFLAITLHIFLITILVWLKYREKIQRGHYYSFGMIAFTLTILLIAHLDKILAIVGKNTNLTGRIPLWSHLIKVLISSSPIVGYGLGTVWTSENFRIGLAQRMGWVIKDTGEVIQIINAHNGYIDIALYLGAIGFIIFVAICAQALVRASKRFKSEGEINSAFGLMTLVYLLITNLTTSFFFEFEIFHWMLLVIILFMYTKPNVRQTASFNMLHAP